MPLPMSKNQVRRLGARLRDAEAPSEEDLVLVQQVLEAYDEALRLASERLWNDLGITSSGRLKNLGTIIEKLRREAGTNLAGIQDIAGRRIVLDRPVGRAEQDRVATLVVGAFGDSTHPPRVHDRRESPSRGYRAVHVVVTVDGLPVEIQIRTHWQQRWAELFEKLADWVGRDIRYEDGRPDVTTMRGSLRFSGDPDLLEELVEHLVEAASSLANMISSLESMPGPATPATVELWAHVEQLTSVLSSMIDGLRSRL